MSNEESVFKALASPVRREILYHLRSGELAAGDIAAMFDMAAPTISRHLGVLKAAALVSERRDANRVIYSASQENITATLTDFLGMVCPSQKAHKRKANRKETR